jgi:glycerophosphoryl diester phosphodiesterase
LRAVQEAHAAGYWVEIDIRLSADNSLHLMHDPTVDRTTNCTGEVATMTDTQLAACNVPTLESVIRNTTGTLELDIKDASASAAMIVVADLSAHDRVLYYASADANSPLLHQPCPVIWSVVTLTWAQDMQRVMRSQDMYALRVTDLWNDAPLVRYVTRHSRNLDVAMQGSLMGDDQLWYIRGIPVTHVEVDNALSFETNLPSPAMPELVYRASAIGIIIAYCVGCLVSLIDADKYTLLSPI